MAVAITIHFLSALIWVGGMFFAYMALRPVAASLLEPPVRLALWSQTFARFFTWVWLSIILLPSTGLWMIFNIFGGMEHLGLHIKVMMWTGFLMIFLFLHMFFGPYRRLKLALADEQIKEAARRLNQIRIIIAINLTLGLFVVITATAGEHIF